jgi:hypothetical protein
MKMIAHYRFFAALALAWALFAGCGGSQNGNGLSIPPLASTPAEPQRKNWFEQTSDDAWNAVASPVSGIIPKSKPKVKQVEEPGVAEGPPEMVIITPGNRGLTTEEPNK